MHFSWILAFAVASLAFTLSSAAALPAGEDIVVQKRTPPLCLPFNCPQVSHGTPICVNPGSGPCGFTCDKGYKAEGKACVAVSPTKKCDKSKCPKVSHSVSFCTTHGDCDYTCEAPYKKAHGRCAKACDKSKCPKVDKGSAYCTTSGDCSHSCNSGFKKQGAKCVKK